MLKAYSRRTALIVIFLAVFLLALSACGSTTGTQVAPAATQAYPGGVVTSDPNLAYPGAGEPAEVSVERAKQLFDEGVYFLDVREPSEWAEGHIPGATLIPLGELQARLSELPKGKPIVVYCRSGNRSATGRDTLTNAGFPYITSMGGGFNQWVSKGYPTTTE
jgi:rhodanese-related sulfurtransferase